MSGSGKDRTHRVGDYVLITKPRLGSGSYGSVYKAHHVKTGDVVAVKAVVRAKLNPKELDNLSSEISIMRSLRHPNVVELVDIIKTEKYIFLVMEYCDGGDLSHYLRQVKRLDEAAARDLLQQLASGLEFMRQHNLIHRDLKPQNLLLVMEPTSGQRPILKIADFGFARVLADEDLAKSVCGSPLYMAPEILRCQPYDAKADLWSVGAILYEMVVGEPPFSAKNRFELLKTIERTPVRFPEDLAVSPELVSLVRDGLLKHNPMERAGYEEFFLHPFLDFANYVRPPTPSPRPTSGGSTGRRARDEEAAAGITVTAVEPTLDALRLPPRVVKAVAEPRSYGSIGSPPLTPAARPPPAATATAVPQPPSPSVSPTPGSGLASSPPLNGMSMEGSPRMRDPFTRTRSSEDRPPEREASSGPGPSPANSSGEVRLYNFDPALFDPALRAQSPPPGHTTAADESSDLADYVMVQNEAENAPPSAVPTSALAIPPRPSSGGSGRTPFTTTPPFAMKPSYVPSLSPPFGAPLASSPADSTSVAEWYARATGRRRSTSLSHDQLLENLDRVGKRASVVAELSAEYSGKGQHAEALALRVKALQMYQEAMTIGRMGLQAEGGSNANPSINLAVQMLAERFTECLEQAEQTRRVTASSLRDGSDAAETVVSPEKIIYKHAIRLGREAGADELLGNLTNCEVKYQMALLLLEILTGEGNLLEEDRTMLEAFVDGVTSRVRELRGRRRAEITLPPR